MSQQQIQNVTTSLECYKESNLECYNKFKVSQQIGISQQSGMSQQSNIHNFKTTNFSICHKQKQNYPKKKKRELTCCNEVGEEYPSIGIINSVMKDKIIRNLCADFFFFQS